jgi:hypothetical protein
MLVVGMAALVATNNKAALEILVDALPSKGTLACGCCMRVRAELFGEFEMTS